MTPLAPARLRPFDIVRLAAYGLRSRPLRVVLSALGIAIGIAAMIAVVGISTSSRARLNQLLTELGTNLLIAGPGTSMFGEPATMPPESIAMIGHIADVDAVTAVGQLADAKIYRTNRIPQNQSGDSRSLPRSSICSRPSVRQWWLAPGSMKRQRTILRWSSVRAQRRGLASMRV